MQNPEGHRIDNASPCAPVDVLRTALRAASLKTWPPSLTNDRDYGVSKPPKIIRAISIKTVNASAEAIALKTSLPGILFMALP